MVAPYQVMPPLASEEFDSLKADIAARGVQVPVEYDELDNILDGHHRVQACVDLGIVNWPRLIRHGLSEQDKRRHARRLNLDRRHLNGEQKRALIVQELKENPEASDRSIGAGLNVDHKTVGAARSTLESTGEIPQLTERAGRDKRVRRITQFVPSNPEEEKGLQMSARALNWRNESENRDSRRNLARELSEASVAFSPDGQKVACIYADPPWHRKQGVTNRCYENHYPTMTWDDICVMPVAQRLLPDAWLFLWIPRAHMFALHPVTMEFADDDGRVILRTVLLPLAWAVARAWGFDSYSTAFVWTKTDEEHPDDQGGGVIAYDQDEILLLFKRGRGLPKPATDEKFKSNHRERKREHSRKPDHYREMIRTMTGGVPVLELFARVDDDNPLPPDWIGWGNQAHTIQPADVAAPLAERGVHDDHAAGLPAPQDEDTSAPETGTVDPAGAPPADPDAAVPPAVRPGLTSDEAELRIAKRARTVWPAGHCVAMTNPVIGGVQQNVGTCACGVVFRFPWPSYVEMDAAIEAHWQAFDDVPSKVDGRGEPVELADAEITIPTRVPGEYDRDEHHVLGMIHAGASVVGDGLRALRGRKLITGKAGALKLTKAGAERLKALDAEHEHQRQLDLLPSSLRQLTGMYGNHLFKLHHCVVAGDYAGAARQAGMLELLQERANGNTIMGMACDDSPSEQLRAGNVAPIGQEPLWHQRGIFRIEVAGIPHIVAHDEDGGLRVHAEDPDKPFLSETGFRSFLASYALGMSVAQCAEAVIRDRIDNVYDEGGKARPRTALTPMPKPACVYRMPTPQDGGTDAIKVSGSIWSAGDAAGSKPAPPVIDAAVDVDDDMMDDMMAVLSAIANGDRQGGFYARQAERWLIGDGLLEANDAGVFLTSTGREELDAWTGRQHLANPQRPIPPAKPRRKKASTQIDIEDLLGAR